MPIKKRRITPRKKPKALDVSGALARMGDILAAGHGDEAMARQYFQLLYADRLARMQSIAAKAEKLRSWDFMKGCYKQAGELYVLASVVYEQFPEYHIMTDATFDALAKWLHKNFSKLDDDFKDYYVLTVLDLKASTGHRVRVQDPIRWMVYILTGKEIPNGRETPHKRPRVLRKPTKRRSKPAQGSGGSASGRTVGASGSGGKLRKKPQAGKRSGATGGGSGASLRKPKKRPIR